LASEALASCVEALRARTGSVRFEEESLAFRILEMEAEKAAGSLRFWSFFLFGLLEEAAVELESESEAEAEAEEVEGE